MTDDAAHRRDHVLIAFRDACPVPSAADIADWVDRYPDLAGDIRGHAEAQVGVRKDRQHLGPESSKTRIFRRVATALDAEPIPVEAVASTAKLKAIITAAGIDVKRLARALGIGRAPVIDAIQNRIAPSEPAAPPAVVDAQPPRAAYPIGELDAYLCCPARYDAIDDVVDLSPPSGGRQMMDAVLSAARDLEALAARGDMPTYDDGATALATAWAAMGPVDHRHERRLRDVAELLVSRLTEVVSVEFGAVHHHPRWTVDVGTGQIVVVPHRVVEDRLGNVTVQIVGARRRDQSRLSGQIAALSVGARAAFPGAHVVVEFVDPDDGAIVMVGSLDQPALGRYRGAIADIELSTLMARLEPHGR